MKIFKNFIKNYKMLLIIYFLLSISFLTKFPFIHSDESWLSGLSRNYVDKGTPITTEAFFDLLPRFPHAIKIIYHYIQAIFIKAFGYNVFSIRLMSLIFGILALIMFYKLAHKITRSKTFSIIIMSFLAFDIQFIYASHFARQEIVILFLLISSVYISINKNLRYSKYSEYLNDIMIGIITGLSIGIHPNSFFIAVSIGFIYLYKIYFVKCAKLKDLLLYAFVTAIFAAIFVGISLYFDSEFFYNYKNFGSQFGVFYDTGSKITQIKDFYLKLYYGVSGTYYTPNVKFQLLLFPMIILISIILKIKTIYTETSTNIGFMLVIILGINITYMIIGRYNQTSIIFIFPFCYLLLGIILLEMNIKFRNVILITIIFALIITSVINVLPFLNDDYDKYISNIEKVVGPNNKVLANLNAEFYFDNDHLVDYRNLHFLKDNNISFSEYLNKRNIKYIIYPEEMDFIYGRRPVWNGIYGNLYYYYDDMKAFLDNNCELIHEFYSPYAMRIVRYMYKQPWKVKIYRVIYNKPVSNTR